MFALELDLEISFAPPMDDDRPGIRLTRTIELPFAPSTEVTLFSKTWEGVQDPLGCPLKEIIWDVDRSCFLAKTQLSNTGVPIALIPYEIHRLLGYGWRFGSFKDHYNTDGRRRKKRKKLPLMRIRKWDDNEAVSWETSSAKFRPKEFKTVLQAVVTTMAELKNNCAVAYAMLRTSGYVDVLEDLRDDKRSPFQRKFAAAVERYQAMTFEAQWDWCEAVQRRYPRMADVLDAFR